MLDSYQPDLASAEYYGFDASHTEAVNKYD